MWGKFWGQSQGGILTHLYTLAWPENPLVTKFGVISQGASATLNLSTVDDVYQDFDIVAKGLGCNYGDDSKAELECMRQISWVQIEEYINRYNSTPAIAFTNYMRKFLLLNMLHSPTTNPISADEKYIFSDEAARYAKGKVARGPSIRSDTAREFPSTNTTEVNEEEKTADCLALSDSKMRQSIGLETHRYYWAGMYSSPLNRYGANEEKETSPTSAPCPGSVHSTGRIFL